MANFENGIGQEMQAMHNNMANMEQQMQNTFKDSMNGMPEFEAGNGLAADPQDGQNQQQSFSSSSTSEMGADGKMHTKTVKSGDQVMCHNGKCKEIKCADGNCKEYIREQKAQQPHDKSHARHHQTQRKHQAPAKKHQAAPRK